VKRRKRMHLKNFDYRGSSHIYYLTLCTAGKQPHFRDERIAGSIEAELQFRREREISLYCYCTMPDHLHLLVSLKDQYSKSLIKWVTAFKRSTSRSAAQFYGIKPLWQENFYDHVVRTDESLTRVAEYILNNPVRKEIVENWEEYPFSGLVDPFPW